MFIGTIGELEAKHAFESAYKNITVSLNFEKLEQIKDIPCLILWGENDKLIPPSHMDKFRDIFKVAKKFIIDDAGHSPHAEKPAIVYEKIKTFLI